MGEKDITEKMLADYNDVFADIVNVLLFNGKQVVNPDDLENVKDKSQYKAEDGKVHEEERDVVKVLKKQNIRISLIGLENQTKADPDEPLRVIGYDGASYRSQLLRDSKERYPVVTIVLYFGTKRWNKGKSLYDVISIPDEWKPFVQNYEINLFEITFLEPEQVALFKSDFRIVADYFVQKRTNSNYVPTQETITHVDEMLKLMDVLTNDSRFQDMQQCFPKGGAISMCDVLDKVEEKGRVEGAIKVYLKLGYTTEQIAKEMEISVDEVNNIIEKSKEQR